MTIYVNNDDLRVQTGERPAEPRVDHRRSPGLRRAEQGATFFCERWGVGTQAIAGDENIIGLEREERQPPHPSLTLPSPGPVW